MCDVDIECTHISFLKLVDVVFADDQLSSSGVPEVSNQTQINRCICAAAADSARAHRHSVFDPCRSAMTQFRWNILREELVYCSWWRPGLYTPGSGSATESPVALSSLTTSLSSSFVSSQRSQGNLYFSFVNVFIKVAWLKTCKASIDVGECVWIII